MNWIINIITAFFIIYSVIIVKKEKLSIRDYLKTGFNKYSKQDIIVGFLIGFIAITGIFIMELNLNYIKFSGTNNIDAKLLSNFISLGFIALGEELLFRGFMLNGLTHLSKNKYLAVVITAVLFGLAHAGNPDATPVSIISNGLGGLMYALAFIASESIWLPFALHFAWNVFQGPVFGFPVSGLNFGGIINQQFTKGKIFFNGGGYGPEGGIIGISFRIVVIVLLLLYYFLGIKKRENSISESKNIGTAN